MVLFGLMVVFCGTGLACQDQPNNKNENSVNTVNESEQSEWRGKNRYGTENIFIGTMKEAIFMAIYKTKNPVWSIHPANEKAKKELKEYIALNNQKPFWVD